MNIASARRTIPRAYRIQISPPHWLLKRRSIFSSASRRKREAEALPKDTQQLDGRTNCRPNILKLPILAQSRLGVGTHWLSSTVWEFISSILPSKRKDAEPDDLQTLETNVLRLKYKISSVRRAPSCHHDLVQAAVKTGRVEASIGYKFTDAMLCIQALKNTEINFPLYTTGVRWHMGSNKTLSMLGDRVLNLAMCEIWFEGILSSKYYHHLRYDRESRRGLAILGRSINLHENMLLADQSRANSENVLAETMEALLAAVYLDSDHSLARVKEVLKHLGHDEIETKDQDGLSTKKEAFPNSTTSRMQKYPLTKQNVGLPAEHDDLKTQHESPRTSDPALTAQETNSSSTKPLVIPEDSESLTSGKDSQAHEHTSVNMVGDLGDGPASPKPNPKIKKRFSSLQIAEKAAVIAKTTIAASGERISASEMTRLERDLRWILYIQVSTDWRAAKLEEFFTRMPNIPGPRRRALRFEVQRSGARRRANAERGLLHSEKPMKQRQRLLQAMQHIETADLIYGKQTPYLPQTEPGETEKIADLTQTSGARLQAPIATKSITKAHATATWPTQNGGSGNSEKKADKTHGGKTKFAPASPRNTREAVNVRKYRMLVSHLRSRARRRSKKSIAEKTDKEALVSQKILSQADQPAKVPVETLGTDDNVPVLNKGTLTSKSFAQDDKKSKRHAHMHVPTSEKQTIERGEVTPISQTDTSSLSQPIGGTPTSSIKGQPNEDKHSEDDQRSASPRSELEQSPEAETSVKAWMSFLRSDGGVDTGEVNTQQQRQPGRRLAYRRVKSVRARVVRRLLSSTADHR